MKTRITEMLGIPHPIVQTGMGWVSDSNLVCASCNAGGLGILSPAGLTHEELRQEIREIKSRVNGKPFGVNLSPAVPGLRQFLEVIIEEQVPVLNSGLRNPFRLANMEKPEDLLYIPTVGNARQAVSSEKQGAAAVIVQGWEGGGHTSFIATTVVIPEVVKAVKIPVISAGGFSDGKGLVAALALGAEAIAMGTRFALAQESPLPSSIKEKCLKARSEDAEVSRIWDGFPQRVIRGEKMKRYRGWWTAPWRLPFDFLSTKRAYQTDLNSMMDTVKFLRSLGASIPQFMTGMEMYRRSTKLGDFSRAYFPAGQTVGLIEDLPTCSEIIERTVAEAEDIIRKLGGRLPE